MKTHLVALSKRRALGSLSATTNGIPSAPLIDAADKTYSRKAVMSANTSVPSK